MTVRVSTAAIAALVVASAGVTFTQTTSVPAQARLKAFDAQVAPLVAKMTLEEKSRADDAARSRAHQRPG
jgi:hypothetical protein